VKLRSCTKLAIRVQYASDLILKGNRARELVNSPRGNFAPSQCFLSGYLLFYGKSGWVYACYFGLSGNIKIH
jgi:hypothetical protein